MQIMPGVSLVAVKPCANMRYRDAAGFCLLSNRCWAGRPCPKSDRQVERARAELVAEASRLAGVSR